MFPEKKFRVSAGEVFSDSCGYGSVFGWLNISWLVSTLIVSIDRLYMSGLNLQQKMGLY